MRPPDILRALVPVARVLDTLKIPYYIGGSVASSLYGLARATLDVDIAARIALGQVSSLQDSLQNEYYVDEDMIAEAINRRSSFNLIHLATSIKIDVFVPIDGPFQRTAMERKVKDTLSEDDPTAEFYFSSPEDVILNKLKWYELGGRVSERQWLDVTGVIKVQGDSLDQVYLQHWSEDLGISILLKKAFTDAGVQFHRR
jgi:hypothetical protein